jgi:hypothetical protein
MYGRGADEAVVFFVWDGRRSASERIRSGGAKALALLPHPLTFPPGQLPVQQGDGQAATRAGLEHGVEVGSV